MGNRKIDGRRIKIHFDYSVSEAAKLLGVHKNTVKQWVKSGGLAVFTDSRPHLILGRELKRFLKAKKQASRKPCAAGELFCMKCRTPRRAAGDLLDYEPLSPTTGNMKGICSACETFIFRRIARAKITVTFPGCHVAFPQCQQRLA